MPGFPIGNVDFIGVSVVDLVTWPSEGLVDHATVDDMSRAGSDVKD